MTLLEKVRAAHAEECVTPIRVTFVDGHTPREGLFTEYTYDDDNEEGIASINISVGKDSPEYCLFENEIDTIEVI